MIHAKKTEFSRHQIRSLGKFLKYFSVLFGCVFLFAFFSSNSNHLRYMEEKETLKIFLKF